MQKWFSEQIDQSFTAFGSSHIAMLVTYSLISIGILMMSGPLQKSILTHNIVKISLFCLLVLSEISYQAWAVIHGVWMEGTHLPLHLCGIASLLGAWALLTYHPKLIKITYFIGVLPAAIALVTPDIPHDYNHFRFWKFFIHHMAISWTSLFLVVSTSVKITWKDLFETLFYLLIYSFFIFAFNRLAGTNYLYLDGPPVTGTPLSWMGEGFMYYLNLVFTAFLLFSLMVLFHKGYRKFSRMK